MIKLEITCESAEEARIYINAPQLQNLVTDFFHVIRNSRKHVGTEQDIFKLVETYFNEFAVASNHPEGPY